MIDFGTNVRARPKSSEAIKGIPRRVSTTVGEEQKFVNRAQEQSGLLRFVESHEMGGSGEQKTGALLASNSGTRTADAAARHYLPARS